MVLLGVTTGTLLNGAKIYGDDHIAENLIKNGLEKCLRLNSKYQMMLYSSIGRSANKALVWDACFAARPTA